MPPSCLAVMSPVSIAELTIAVSTSPSVVIEVAIASITPVRVVELRSTIASATIPPSVTCVVTVNKLFTLPVPM